jgi:tetratricopeptide (TPR) repeat protein
MYTLRLTQTPESEGRYRVEVTLEGDGLPRQTATAGFDFAFGPQDGEDLRWYLEDYLQHPLEPAPRIAERVEQRMAEVGTSLFRAVFQSGDDARDLWATLRTALSDTRVEVVTGVREAATVPWELLRDPTTNTPLALRARSFVRAHPQPQQRPALARADSASLRILLVICRPGGDDDVPFRSVAMRILKGLSASESRVFQLDVLRPPTFERLGDALRHAKAEGHPYHVVHFDGHGMFLDLERLFDAQAAQGEEAEELPDALSDFDPRRFSPRTVYPREPREGSRGYLAFENPQGRYNLRLVDGPELGALLVETGVPLLVLNACRSAHAEPPATPEEAREERDPHEKVRAFGSLAQEVMDAGVAGVVAMRYNVYVVTAAQFVADLYAALAEGQAFGEAATLGRKKLSDQPLREVAYDPLPLQDWVVPVAYEAAPLSLVPRRRPDAPFSVSLKAGQSAAARGALDPQLPKQPDAGFFGRDGTLLKLDRLFDTQRIILLHAYAGSGKTATVAEFARWYSLTDGVEGPVLFTSFEHHRTLARVLDQLGQTFGETLERAGVNWLALEDDERCALALDVLRQIPVLWIWDNVEPVAGFPAGTPSAWSADEQRELADFLRDARDTKAKFLLTSRRDERGWLGDLPARVELPPMPMQERVQFARALAERHGKRITDVDDWRPLLNFTQGNPLTITVLVGQALRDKLQTRKQIEAFVARLRAGESAFEDEASEGRTKSLGASLSYGFEHAFNEQERRQLSLLHFFQGFVDVDALCWMGNADNPACLPELKDLTREAGVALLDRATEVGLLTAAGDGYYFIHPALPWYFKNLFKQFYAVPAPGETDSEIRTVRAYVGAVASLAGYYADEYDQGNTGLISNLTVEEYNLLHVRQLARAHGWWGEAISAMRSLGMLYNQTGRTAEWKKLVDEIVPDFVDPNTGMALPGRGELWGFVIFDCVLLAKQARQWAEAERLVNLLIDSTRQRAALALATPPEELDREKRNDLHSLGSVLHELGEIQRQVGDPQCVAAYEEALEIAEKINSAHHIAVCAFNLGHAYRAIPAIRDLARAESLYRRSLELCGERDRLGRGKCYYQLGHVALDLLESALAADQPAEMCIVHLNTAAESYHESLKLLPSNAVDDLAIVYSGLGRTYLYTGALDRASAYCQEAIRLWEDMGDLFAAGGARCNMALALLEADRLEDAREYAYAAMRNFESYGSAASGRIEKTRRLIEYIEERLRKRGE